MITLTMRRIKDDPVLTSSRLSSRAGVTLRTGARSTTRARTSRRLGRTHLSENPSPCRGKGLCTEGSSLSQNEKPRRVETGGEAGRGGLKQNGARSSRDGRLLRLTLSDLLTVFRLMHAIFLEKINNLVV